MCVLFYCKSFLLPDVAWKQMNSNWYVSTAFNLYYKPHLSGCVVRALSHGVHRRLRNVEKRAGVNRGAVRAVVLALVVGHLRLGAYNRSLHRLT
jgi:hypothetical protein